MICYFYFVHYCSLFYVNIAIYTAQPKNLSFVSSVHRRIAFTSKCLSVICLRYIILLNFTPLLDVQTSAPITPGVEHLQLFTRTSTMFFKKIVKMFSVACQLSVKQVLVASFISIIQPKKNLIKMWRPHNFQTLLCM